jgi:hypothetical protein
MKKYLPSCIYFLIVLGGITGCVAKKGCLNACQAKLVHCKQVCIDNCAICTKKSSLKTFKRYEQYIHEQKIQGKMVARELQAYRDPLECRKVTCHCQADYQVCMQSHAGFIHKNLQVVPACDEN